MEHLVAHGWTSVAAPVMIAAIIVLAGRGFARWVAALSAFAPVWVLAVGVAAVLQLSRQEGGVLSGGSAQWLGAGLSVGWTLDGLSAVMLVVIGVVALCVIVFSSGYISPEEDLPRYYGALALFTGAMALLVIADGFLGLFIGWELVGVCSYLLIGFWHTRPSAAAAAMKAFVTTRVADVGLVLAIAIIYAEVGDVSYAAVFAAVPEMSASTLVTIGVLLFVGAAGKSAQFPFHVWLPDAMEGPTPVSALIHAATMVAAGVYLLVRVWPVIEASAAALSIVLAVGSLTAIAGAAAACAQRDLKRVLAYSTVSQLGFMFAAIGVGAWNAAIIHLIVHAAFKSLLFLAAADMVRTNRGGDLRSMGRTARPASATTLAWLVGAVSLAGVPPFAGFFSKDKLVDSVWATGTPWTVVLLIAGAFTALYVARVSYHVLTRSADRDALAGALGWRASVPFAVLGVLSAGLGLFIEPVTVLTSGRFAPLDPLVAVTLAAMTLLGAGAGIIVARDERDGGRVRSNRFATIVRLARSGWGVDALVAGPLGQAFASTLRAIDANIDRGGVDRVVEGIASRARRAGGAVTQLQSGDAQWYAAMVAAGAVVLMAVAGYLARGV